MLRKSISDSRSEKETISEAREKTVRLGCAIIYTFMILILQNAFTSIHISTHPHIRTFIWHKLHTYIHTYIQTDEKPYLPPYIHTYIRTYIHRSVIQNDRQVEELNVELEKVADKLRNAGDDKRRLFFIHTYIHTFIHTYTYLISYLYR